MIKILAGNNNHKKINGTRKLGTRDEQPSSFTLVFTRSERCIKDIHEIHTYYQVNILMPTAIKSTFLRLMYTSSLFSTLMLSLFLSFSRHCACWSGAWEYVMWFGLVDVIGSRQHSNTWANFILCNDAGLVNKIIYYVLQSIVLVLFAFF